jgi:hypothetical protein
MGRCGSGTVLERPLASAITWTMDWWPVACWKTLSTSTKVA